MATLSYMACVDTSSAGDGTTERSGYRTDMPVGGYKDTSRKMPDWKQQDAAESITTKRSADGNELGKQLRSWQKSTPGSPQHPYTRTDAKGALKDNGNYSAKQVWRSCFTNRRFSVAVCQCDRRDFPELTCSFCFFFITDITSYVSYEGIKPLPLKVCLSSVSFSVSSASRDVLPTRSCMQRLLLANASLGNRRIPS
ncbi:Imidazole glycerol phosphate synthase subunit HisF [Trichinella spiralis]|uniref:Imidazole glycerol phosphate synthase subunit HisF n=1 Tax=Trichinella spiralis TaxID=6334 RepID=A0ABR3KJQ8_TRISP